MDWAVDTTYLIFDASSDVISVRSSKHKPGHRHHNQTVLVAVMQPPHPGLIGTCAAVACPFRQRSLLSPNLAMAPLQEARHWLRSHARDSSSLGGMPHALRLALRLSLNLLSGPPMLRVPSANCPYSVCFGILSSSMRITWPVHRNSWGGGGESCWCADNQ